MNVKNFIDLHVHIGPEVIPRKFTVNTVAKEEKGKIAGMALKSQFFPTTPLIKSENKGEGIILVGSVTLNNSVGGLNPDAIYASARISEAPIIVWFPTISAGQFLDNSKYEIPPEWVGKGFKSRLSKDPLLSKSATFLNSSFRGVIRFKPKLSLLIGLNITPP